MARAFSAVLKGKKPIKLTTWNDDHEMLLDYTSVFFYLRKFGDISDALLHLGEEGGDLLELLQLEESVAGGVLVQDEVWGHDGSN